MVVTRSKLLVLTLLSFVNPLIIHSSTSAGASTDAELAGPTIVSETKLMVNCFVARMLSRVSFGLLGDRLKDKLTKGGL